MFSTFNMAALLGVGTRKMLTSFLRASRHSSINLFRNGLKLSESVTLNKILPVTVSVRQFSDSVSSPPDTELEFENETAGRPAEVTTRRPQRTQTQGDGKSFSRFAYDRAMRRLGSISSKETLKKQFEHMLHEGMT